MVGFPHAAAIFALKRYKTICFLRVAILYYFNHVTLFSADVLPPNPKRVAPLFVLVLLYALVNSSNHTINPYIQGNHDTI